VGGKQTALGGKEGIVLVKEREHLIELRVG
jgi:hypothetical protein